MDEGAIGLYHLLSLPFALVGLAILGIAEALRRSAAKRRRRATAKADAKIVGRLNQLQKFGKRPAPHFIYEFPVNGVPRRAESAGKRHWKEGDAVAIFYDPSYPEVIHIPEVRGGATAAALYFIGGAWLSSGVLLFVFGMLGIK